MIKGKQQRRRNRRLADQAIQPQWGTVNVGTVTHGTNQVTVTFSSPVQINGGFLPATWLFGTANRTITGIVSASTTAYTFALSGAAAAGEGYVIGGQDPAARTSTGGYVNGKIGVLA